MAFTNGKLEPEDLGAGWKIVFQRMKSDPSQVRAVIKNPQGEIWARGKTVPELEAWASRLEALANSKKRNYHASLGLPLEASDEEVHRAIMQKAIRDAQ